MPAHLRSSLQFRELFCPWKIFERGTILPCLYGFRSKQGVQHPRHGVGRKLLTFGPGLYHGIVGYTEPPGAAKEIVGIQKKFSVRHVPGAGYQEVPPLCVGHRVLQGEVDELTPSASWENAGAVVFNKKAIRKINAFEYFMIDLQKNFLLSMVGLSRSQGGMQADFH
jgi:hypothetical protein